MGVILTKPVPSPASGSNGGKTFDDTAQYLVLSSTGSLDNERAFVADTGLISSDGGPGNNLTVSVDDSIVATISGSTFHGATIFDLGLSGSLTHLQDGTSYLVAGDNVTITSESNGAVTVAASSGGSALTVRSGSTLTISNVSSIGGSDGIIITDNGSGFAALTASIGIAEDNDYTEGLFTDFNPGTRLGIAIDRFNEVLKALAPNPAPDLDDINSLDTGITASLSFGTGNDQSSATPSYISVADSAGIANTIATNGIYTVTTSSNNIRIGIFDGTTHISGVLNADISSNSQGSDVENYPAFSFGDADTGVLRLDVNDNTLKEIDLTLNSIGSGSSGAYGTGSYVDADGSGFNFFSLPTTGTLSNGNAFSSFKHRTGQFVVASNSQRRGWNYARVLHVKSGSTITANYIEWVNDDNSSALAADGNSIVFVGNGSINLSGVEYFKSGSVEYNSRISNAYAYVYDTNDITFTTSNTALLSSNVSYSISSQTKPTIDTGSAEDHDKILHLTGSSTVTADYFLSGALTTSTNVSHPLKSDLVAGGESSLTGILMYNLSNTSTNQSETFLREDYRIISGAYDTQASLYNASNIWDSSKHLTASNGDHSNGLQFYNSGLYSPIKTANSGDFRDSSEGGLLDNAPLENPNYSSESGTRTFYRWFKNETGSTKYDLTLTLQGTGTIVSSATTFSGTRLKVFAKFPNNGTRETGWLDLATEFVLDSYSDNDGAHTANGSLSFDSSLNATNYITLGTVGIADDEYVGIRIETDASWTGYISSISVTFGSGTGSIAATPDLDDIDCNDDGTDCNLSFGSSKAITGYTSTATTAGFGATDINGLYETDSASNNLRRSVFALDRIVEGDLNEDVSSASPDYVANSFSDANSGSLKLEINGSVIHTVEITGSYNLVGAGSPGSGTAIATGSNGSGFYDLSIWSAAEFDNEIPYYLEIYRTGKYRVAIADQRNGWNYARVIHSVSGTDRETNYVEWINDNNSNVLSEAGGTLQPFQDDNVFYQSGVKYFIQPSGSYDVRVSNIYKNVYSDSTSALSFTSLSNATGVKIIQSGSGLSSTKTTSSSTDSLQTLNTNTNSETEILHVSGTLQFSVSGSLSGSHTTAVNCAAAMIFVHPLKSNLTSATLTATALHVYSGSDDANANTNEHFNGETYRIQSSSYGISDTQLAVTTITNVWSPTGSLNNGTDYSGYYTGLMTYDGKLVSPLDGGVRGDFRNHTDGGGIEGPSNNVDYSSLGETTREYYRGFLNNTTDDRPNVTVTLYGDAILVGKTGGNIGTLGVNKNIFVEVSVPSKTAFLDLGKPSPGSGNYNEGDGCLSGDLDATIDSTGAVNTCTFNAKTVDGTVSGAEYLVIKISASSEFRGYISQVDIAWS